MENVRDVVNGAQLPRFLNKPVSIIGQVKEIDPSGRSLTLSTTDDMTVKVKLKEPTRQALSGWVEVRGKSTGQGIDADHCIVFTNSDIETKGYNSLATFLYTVPNLWKTS